MFSTVMCDVERTANVFNALFKALFNPIVLFENALRHAHMAFSLLMTWFTRGILFGDGRTTGKRGKRIALAEGKLCQQEGVGQGGFEGGVGLDGAQTGLKGWGWGRFQRENS